MFKDVFAASDEEVKIRSVKSISTSIKQRFDSIDLLRGLVMVLMALDHVRDYFTSVRFDPLDLSQTTVQLFLTRWITHYCAPVFVFLAGTGAFLSLGRGKSKSDVAKFLLSRGLWLILLEFTLVRLGWTFGFDYSLLVGQVIWALGCSMVFLSFLIYLPFKALAAFSIIMILAHNLFDGVTPEQFGSFSWLWIILHNFEAIDLGGGYTFFAAYPLIPWIGVMAAGYCFGALYNLEAEKRKKILLRLGIGMIGGFVLLRLFDFYGDFNKWTTQKNFIFTLLDFIDTRKYPPSLLFLLMTLGPAILFLSFLEKARELNKSNYFFIVFGRVPLFYYLLHIPVIHILAVLVANATEIDPGFMFGSYPFFWETDWGYSLPAVYLVWVFVVTGLYPLCHLYNNFKKKKKSKLLSYL
ncbi:MAG: heparan-alpha-glucosaminide N-acetyltransferase domain-containing protein [Ignavibacteria bacterium]|nr:heparan-alpha-glucosaminide N-acetyltransferase domain-containing protein [Ignavibacteria bacterium]